MASVRKRLRKGRALYSVRWVDGAGVRRETAAKFPTKAKAEAFAADAEANAIRQREGLAPIVPRGAGVTLWELLLWHWEKKIEPVCKRRVRSLLRSHFEETPLASRPVASLRTLDFREFLDAKRATHSAGTCSSIRRHLHAVYEYAKERERWWGENPVKPIKLPKAGGSAGENYLRREEVAPLLKELPKRFRRMVATAIFLGLRKGELCALQKCDVDLDAGRVAVRRSWGRNKAKAREDGEVDYVPIPPPLVPFLKAAIAESPCELVFPSPRGGMYSETGSDFASPLRAGLRRAGIVTGYTHVCRRRGCEHSEAAADKELRRCPVHGAKLWPRAQVRPIRFHDLRHSTASLLIQSGAAVVHAQKIMRHSDPRLTASLYGHMAPGDLQPAWAGVHVFSEAPEALPELLAAAGGAVEGLDFKPSGASAGATSKIPQAGAAFTERAILESNQWPSAPEADALSS